MNSVPVCFGCRHKKCETNYVSTRRSSVINHEKRIEHASCGTSCEVCKRYRLPSVPRSRFTKMSMKVVKNVCVKPKNAEKRYYAFRLDRNADEVERIKNLEDEAADALSSLQTVQEFGDPKAQASSFEKPKPKRCAPIPTTIGVKTTKICL